MYVVAHVDEQGIAHSVSILPSGNFDLRDEINQFLATAFMAPKYKPGKCNGVPCAMDFAVSVNYFLDSHE